jgi:hypothetical protein
MLWLPLLGIVALHVKSLLGQADWARQDISERTIKKNVQKSRCVLVSILLPSLL